MNTHFFTLRPFGGMDQNPPHLRITGQVSRYLQSLTIAYQVAGELMALDLPESSEAPERRAFLWQNTCFELFFKEPGLKIYWEINISPAGHWNIYRFDGYRKGMREETGITAPRIHSDSENEGILKISTDIHLDGITAFRHPIQLAASAVIKTLSGQITYWALNHPGPEPDFHHKNSFMIRLE